MLLEAVPEEEEAKHRRMQERSRAEVVLAEEEAFRNHCQQIAGLLKIRASIFIVSKLVDGDIGVSVVFLQIRRRSRRAEGRAVGTSGRILRIVRRLRVQILIPSPIRQGSLNGAQNSLGSRRLGDEFLESGTLSDHVGESAAKVTSSRIRSSDSANCTVDFMVNGDIRLSNVNQFRSIAFGFNLAHGRRGRCTRSRTVTRARIGEFLRRRGFKEILFVDTIENAHSANVTRHVAQSPVDSNWFVLLQIAKDSEHQRLQIAVEDSTEIGNALFKETAVAEEDSLDIIDQ